MGLKSRRTGLLDRNRQFRDLWLCIIATEGADTEPEYFTALQARGLISRSRVKIIPLPTEATEGEGPDPQHVLQRLIRFEAENMLLPHDQRWLVIDVDHHSQGRHKENFVQVVQEAQQRGYLLAVSNPCFEVWLLLHFQSAEEIRSIALNPRDCKQALGRVRAQHGTAYDTTLYSRQGLERAVVQARTLNPVKEEPWPTSTGTHVYRLAMVLPLA